MLQGGALLDDATVGETVAMVASLHRKPLPVAEVLRRTGIEDLAARRCNKLSGGQKQRVRFAVALVSDPDLLVLDEPTAAMDVAGRRDFWRSMHAFTESGRTVLFATHYLEEAENYADRVVLMRSGRVVADGSVAEVTSLVAGRVLRAAIPGATEQALRVLPGVSEVEVRGEQVTLSSRDSDATLRALLQMFPQAHDIEVTAVGLEGAFLSLTGDGTDSVRHPGRSFPMSFGYLVLELRRAMRSTRFLIFTDRVSRPAVPPLRRHLQQRRQDDHRRPDGQHDRVRRAVRRDVRRRPRRAGAVHRLAAPAAAHPAVRPGLPDREGHHRDDARPARGRPRAAARRRRRGRVAGRHRLAAGGARHLARGRSRSR